MEFFCQGNTSLDVEQHLLKAISHIPKTVEKAKERRERWPDIYKNIYKITITVEQVEPKL